jgi:hypothetical protein
MENRAAVFTSSSQDVEVYQAGAWWTGSLLGWRHEPDGSCQVWVRAVVAGVERSTWTDLVDVRLPERPALHPVPSAVETGRDALTSTISLFAVRDGGADEGAAGPATVVGGHRPGGRRRAPETQEVPAWGAPARPGPAPAAASGRHRAPAPGEVTAAGRHRAADTGAFPPVAADGDAPAGPRRTASTARSRRPESGWAARADSTGRVLPVVPEPAGAAGDGEFYTRPLRLATSVPQPRTPRWDD